MNQMTGMISERQSYFEEQPLINLYRDKRIYSTGCADENAKLTDCYYEKKDWRECKKEMEVFRECWKRHNNDERTSTKDA
ncbi:hypothetical protein F4809DRAFT_600889 [Biscogniauxia mediterranea]|nr:hypothetical protein F4809DRAFT_600889 [Biscogniauxia mediterranea]